MFLISSSFSRRKWLHINSSLCFIAITSGGNATGVAGAAAAVAGNEDDESTGVDAEGGSWLGVSGRRERFCWELEWGPSE